MSLGDRDMMFTCPHFANIFCTTALVVVIRPGLPQKVHELSVKPMLFAGHPLESQRLNDDMHLYMSSLVKLGRGPVKMLVTSDWRNQQSFLLIFSQQFKFDSMSPTLTPGIHMAMAAGVANFTFLTMELAIISVGVSAGVLVSGENLLRNVNWSFYIGLCFLQTVTQPSIEFLHKLTPYMVVTM